MNCIILFSALVFLFIFQTISAAALDELLNDAGNCELRCDEKYQSSSNHVKACAEGCRLFKLIRLAKGLSSNNKTLGLCFSACNEAYINESTAKACNFGCQQYITTKPEDEPQTLHLLTPLFYIKSAYNTVAHHVRQFISASFTFYVQEDSGKVVVLQSSPKVYESSDYYPIKNMDKISFSNHHLTPFQEEDKFSWMDCVSNQSGIPRWAIVMVLIGFISAFLWLCCVTTATAPNHYLTSKKKNVSYVLLCQPRQANYNDLMKPPPPLVNYEEEAPPLPAKVSLI